MAVPELQFGNIGTNFLNAYRQGQQRARGEQFNRLAGQAAQASPAQRDALIAQAVELDPSAGFALGENLNKVEDRRRTQVTNLARGFKQIHSQYKDQPQAAAMFYERQIVPALQQLGFPDIPLRYDEASVLPVVDQILAQSGGGDISERYRVVGNTLVDLQDPTRAIYRAPQIINADQGIFEYGQGGLRDIGQPAPVQGAQSPVVEGPSGEMGRYSIGADGRPVFVAEGVPDTVEAGIVAQPQAFATQDQVTLQPQTPRLTPRGSGAEQERLALARQAAANSQAAADRSARIEQRNIEQAAQERQFGRIPPGFRVNAAGTALEPVPGGPKPAGATATEGERKAATLLKRLDFSRNQLEKAIEEDAGAAGPAVQAEIARGLPFVGDVVANALTPQARQRVEAAQLDILDAALTLGTGAAYTREQLEGYRRSYFPQLNDDPATIADKRARLQNVIEAAEIAAGRAAPQVGGGTGGAGAAPAPRRARNPQTGQVIELRNGQWVPVDGR